MRAKGSDDLKKILTYICILFALVLPLTSCGGPKTVMTVGGYDLTEDVDALLGGSDMRALFLAPYALAEENGIDVKSDEFRDAVSAELERVFSADYGANEEALDAELEAEGISREVYEKIVEQSVLSDMLYLKLTESGKIETDPEILREKFLSGEAVRVKRILVLYSNHDAAEADERINEAAGKLSLGTPFETVMKDYAEYDLANGDLGNLGDSYVVLRGSADADYEKVCFSLSEGETSEPFDTSVGPCIVKRYELTAEDLNTILDDLVSDYAVGQYNLILEEAAEKIR